MTVKQNLLYKFESMMEVVVDSCPSNSQQRIAARYRLIGAVDLMYLSGVLPLSEADQLMWRVYEAFPLTSADLQDLGILVEVV